MRTVFIAYKDGQAASVNGYVAAAGFSARGYKVVWFEMAGIVDFPEGVKPFEGRDDIVFGSVQATRIALKSLGVAAPANIDIPDSLFCYTGRKIWKTTLGEIRAGREPTFIKPLHEHKKFPGHVVRPLVGQYTSFLRTERFPDEEPILAQAVVQFDSEWRVFVLRGEIVGIGHYNGDPLLMPDPERIEEMVKAYHDAPVAYGLDVGRAAGRDTETNLVEVNDAFALGSYGLAAHLYSAMIEARWDEMVAA